jgi:amidophosphoribosyltransferase
VEYLGYLEMETLQLCIHIMDYMLLQHRGQEAAGIVSLSEDSNKSVFKMHKDLGLVSEIFVGEDLFTKKLSGFASIGHNRYSTFGASDSQERIFNHFMVNYRDGNLAVAHNGNLTNARRTKKGPCYGGSTISNYK